MIIFFINNIVFAKENEQLDQIDINNDLEICDKNMDIQKKINKYQNAQSNKNIKVNRN